jgi:prevent-host-death family protein
MTRFNVHDAKTHLSAILDRVEAGEEIVLARSGRPIARIVPIRVQRAPREIGLYAGQPFEIRSDFDHLPDDIARAFEGDTG